MKVKCEAYNYDTNQWDELDISTSLKLYPCCAYHGYYELNEWDDERFKSLPADWNDLKVHDIETIKTKMFAILNVENFNSGNCPNKCKEICGVNNKERHTPTRKYYKDEKI